jgi:hypothetical protein
MESGKKIAIGVTTVFILAVVVRVGLIYKANHEEGPPPKPTYTQYHVDDDQAVNDTLHKEHPDSLKDERSLIGKTLWVSAGGQMDYYHYANHHADYAHPVGVLLGAEPLIVKDAFQQVPPHITLATARIPAGQGHVLLAFTMPKSADPNAVYAVPVGHVDGGTYALLTDQIFFYSDPHTLYSHWGPETWAHIDKHEVVKGMSENQAMMALGQVLVWHGGTPGDRSITYDNDGHPVSIIFEKDKAVTITQDK